MDRGLIELKIGEHAGIERKNETVSSGVPFPEGRLFSLKNVRLLDSDRNEVVCQFRKLARWKDKSVKWVLLDFQVDVDKDKEKVYYVEYGENVVNKGYRTTLSVSSRKGFFEIITGPMKFKVSKKRFGIIEEAWFDSTGKGKFTKKNKIMNPDRDRGISVKSGEDRTVYLSSMGDGYKVEVEEEGPVKVVLKLEGWHRNDKGKRFLKGIARVYFYNNSSAVRVDYTFINADHPNSVEVEQINELVPPRGPWYYHYELSRKAWNYIADLRVSMPLNLNGQVEYTIGDYHPSKEIANLVQYVEYSYYVHKGKKYSREDEVAHGTQSKGWADISNSKWGLTLFVKDFWQNYSKEISFDEKSVKAGLWTEAVPKLAVPKGFAKTHTLYCYFHKGDAKEANSGDMAKTWQNRLMAVADPEWYCSSKAFGETMPVLPGRFPVGEKFIEEQLKRFTENQKKEAWYGLYDYGDAGKSNMEVDYHYGVLLAFIRTGNRAYFDIAEPMAWHFMDVDVRHYHTDKRLEGGVILHGHVDWSVNICHNYVEGLLAYYFLTGYTRAMDVVYKIGECMINIMHEDGLACHDGAVEGESCARDNGRVMIGLSAIYEATLEKKFLFGAKKAFGFLAKTQMGDGSWYQWIPSWLDRKMGFERTENPEKVNVFSEKGGHCTSILLKGVKKLHRITQSKEMKNVFIKGVNYMINSVMTPEGDGFLYGDWGGNALQYAETGHMWYAGRKSFYSETSFRMLEVLAYAYEITSKIEYMNIGKRVYERLLTSNDRGKGHNYLPYFYYTAERLGFYLESETDSEVPKKTRGFIPANKR